ncbi:MAG: ATP-binding cassette domain-containing protein [Tannerellaceae bacterium]|nr:ATP-binding cassette domain-containing protein [Tannerellaceae bacterium]
MGKRVLSGLSMEVCAGDFIVVSGTNGSGKSTLVKVLLGLLGVSKGEVLHPSGAYRVGYLPQVHALDRSFPISVREVIRSGLGGASGLRRSWVRDRIEASLVRVGLSGQGGESIGKLSGGELQRTLLARALVSAPEVLIMDEPESHLDEAFKGEFGVILGEVKAGTSVVLVSHSPESHAGYMTEHIIMNGNVRT